MFAEIVCLKNIDGQLPEPTRQWSTLDQNSLLPEISLQRDFFFNACNMRYAKFQSFSTILSIMAARGIDWGSVDPARTAVLTINGPHTLDVADAFSRTLVTRGAKYVNPVQFPLTLQSGSPCEIAAFFALKGAALSFGSGKNAIYQAFPFAASLIASGTVENILFVCGGLIQPYFLQDKKKENGIGFCALLSKNRRSQSVLEVLATYPYVEYSEISEIASRYNIPRKDILSSAQFIGNELDIIQQTPLFEVLNFISMLQASYRSGQGKNILQIDCRKKSHSALVINWLESYSH